MSEETFDQAADEPDDTETPAFEPAQHPDETGEPVAWEALAHDTGEADLPREEPGDAQLMALASPVSDEPITDDLVAAQAEAEPADDDEQRTGQE